MKCPIAFPLSLKYFMNAGYMISSWTHTDDPEIISSKSGVNLDRSTLHSNVCVADNSIIPW
jgi:hypothetical protein